MLHWLLRFLRRDLTVKMLQY